MAAGLAACSPNIEPHGDLPQADHLSQIEPVPYPFGRAGPVGHPFDHLHLGYRALVLHQQSDKNYAWHPIEEVARLVIIIEFDKAGTVISLKKLELKDGQDIAMVERTTPTSGANLSLLASSSAISAGFDTSTATK